MRRQTIVLIARQFCLNVFHSRAIYGLTSLMFVMIIFAGYVGWKNYAVQNEIRKHYQHEVRESWEKNPDKHPHRMAHFGSFAFRIKHPLSVFDPGLESFTGNAVYLEAHKQNTVNFSEASFSTGLLRFGEISLAMFLQMILSLVIMFLGFNAISGDRENGTLKVMLTQGARWKEILFGKSLGLFALSSVMLFCVFGIALLIIISAGANSIDLALRYAGLVLCYLIFIAIICLLTISISTVSTSSKNSVMTLLGLWLLLAILIPRTSQAIGSYLFSAPSKIEFETAVEEDVIKTGDSHNPDDPHYRQLKDSVLAAHQVDSIVQLPFNYSGFVMREGERISATIFNQHQGALVDIYDRQNSLTRLSSFLNPFAAIRNISMSLSATDFESYKQFQTEAESYRYQLAQTMNELQMKLISNRKPSPDAKAYSISSDYWKKFPDFKPVLIDVMTSFEREVWSSVALVGWLISALGIVIRISKTAKAL